jgi:hypothetical protein
MFGLTQCSSNSSTTNAGTTTSTGATIVPDPDTVSVTTYHYDNSRSGIQPQETALTPTNVNSSTFGKLFSVTVDGLVNAQPLIAANITMSDGQPHTLLLVATENDSVYAFNADTSAKAFWQRSLLQSGETAVPYAAIGTTDINPVIGIVGTPVLDATTNLLYVVAKSYTASGTFIQRLHAINIQTGAEAPNSPVTINPSIAGNASDAFNGQLSFNAKMETQTFLPITDGWLVMTAVRSPRPMYSMTRPMASWAVYGCPLVARHLTVQEIFSSCPATVIFRRLLIITVRAHCG